MTNTEYLDKLQDLSQRLCSVVNDRENGGFSWHETVYRLHKEMTDLWQARWTSLWHEENQDVTPDKV